MHDLYERLGAAGFPEAYVRSRILPGWWRDDQATEPSTRSLAEFSIARVTGISIASLKLVGSPLAVPTSRAKLKRRGKCDQLSIAPGLAVAERAARLTVGAVRSSDVTFPSFPGGATAADIRARILADAGVVTLDTLLHFAWSIGVVVLPVEPPSGSKRFDGMALFVDQTPVVVLASSHKSPPWIAFHLGHELGHILLRHVAPGSAPVVDVGLGGDGGDAQEREADAFAVELLVGRNHPQQPRPMNAQQLAEWASWCGSKAAIDPGSLALVVSHKRKRIPVGVGAVKLLQRHTGAREMVAAALIAHVPDGLPSDLQRLMPCADQATA